MMQMSTIFIALFLRYKRSQTCFFKTEVYSIEKLFTVYNVCSKWMSFSRFFVFANHRRQFSQWKCKQYTSSFHKMISDVKSSRTSWPWDQNFVLVLVLVICILSTYHNILRRKHAGQYYKQNTNTILEKVHHDVFLIIRYIVGDACIFKILALRWLPVTEMAFKCQRC